MSTKVKRDLGYVAGGASPYRPRDLRGEEPRRRLVVSHVSAGASASPAPRGLTPRKVASLTAPSIDIRGEAFAVELSEEKVWLTHPRWSLVGSGRTLAEAEFDLTDEARGLAEAFVLQDPASLSPSALAFRDYLLRHFAG